MKQVEETKWPFFFSSLLIVIYIIVIDNDLIYFPIALSITIVLVLLIMTIGNIFLFKKSAEGRRGRIFGKSFFITNPEAIIFMAMILILLIFFLLSDRRHYYMPYVYSMALIYYGSLMKIEYD